jgi:hypothetical protein
LPYLGGARGNHTVTDDRAGPDHGEPDSTRASSASSRTSNDRVLSPPWICNVQGDLRGSITRRPGARVGNRMGLRGVPEARTRRALATGEAS